MEPPEALTTMPGQSHLVVAAVALAVARLAPVPAPRVLGATMMLAPEVVRQVELASRVPPEATLQGLAIVLVVVAAVVVMQQVRPGLVVLGEAVQISRLVSGPALAVGVGVDLQPRAALVGPVALTVVAVAVVASGPLQVALVA